MLKKADLNIRNTIEEVKGHNANHLLVKKSILK